MAGIIEFQKELLAAKQFMDAQQYDDAWRIIDRVLEDDPNHVPALILAVNLFRSTKRIPISYQFAARCCELAPQLSASWMNLGCAAEELYRLDQAEACHAKALALAKPERRAAIYRNMSATAISRGHWAQSERYARMAIELNPNDHMTKGNLGTALLAQEKWLEGWLNYDEILGGPGRKLIKYGDEPLWDGKPGQTIIVHGEQGLGDEVTFASMLPDAARVCKKVILNCDTRLAPLFARSFPEIKVYGDRWEAGLEVKPEDGEFDASISLAQLGRYFRLRNEDFPGTPYLKADPERSTIWREFFKTKGKPVIGIAWTGGIQSTGAKFRKWGVEQIKPLIEAIDAHWVCLQYKDADADLEAFGLPIHQYKSTTLSKDYDDTAALVANCDLVICVQTAVGHLASALGVPTWMFMCPLSEWKLPGEKARWYDCMRLWRPANGWPIDDAVKALKERYGDHHDRGIKDRDHELA
jgi:tetratricopeptide (TPR) repeat protein